jgi:hypothetical protein
MERLESEALTVGGGATGIAHLSVHPVGQLLRTYGREL